MSQTQNNNKRIAKNTLLLYLRMIFLLSISLFTSRVVLQTLGVEDYGIYNVVGGVVALFAFLNGAMTGATQRYLNFDLAKNDTKALSETFSTALIIHSLIALTLILLSETVGLWFMYEKMVIPEERMTAAMWVLQCAILVMSVNIISVPYNAAIIAHEKMGAFAYISLLEATLKLLIVYMLYISPVDKLILYAILLLTVSVVIRFVYSSYSHKHFKETHFRFIWNTVKLKEMGAFASWNLIGNLALMGVTQGLNMLLNVFFGPVVNAARGDGIMEFGLRRAQGPDAGTLGARAAVIGGCTGTSNVLAGELYGIPVQGTHAHSWIMSFPDELTAFRTYAKMYPDACILLVDTYDTLKSGVPHAIQVFKEMRDAGITSKLMGIRLDSGDIAYLSKKARKMLDEAGFTNAIISASSDLDEYLINSLKTQGCTVTSWGVGTNLITSSDNPAFGGVYKLAAIKKPGDKEFTAKIKISENPEKITNPGNKTVYRIYDKESSKIKADLICLVGETFDPSEDLKIFDPISTWKKSILPAGSYQIREMLVPIFLNGQCVYSSPAVMDIKTYCQQELNTLWDENRRLINPQTVYVDLSQKLFDLKHKLLGDEK